MKSCLRSYRLSMARILLFVTLIPVAVLGFNRRDLLPDDRMATIEFSNSADFFLALRQTAIGRIWQDTEVQAFIGNADLAALIRDTLFSGKDEEQKALYWETLKMLDGETIVSFTAGDAIPAIIAEMSEDVFLRSLEIDQRIAELKRDGTMTILRHTFEGVDLIQHIEESPDKPEPQESWQAHLGNTFIYGPDRDWIEKSIVRLRRDPPAERDDTTPVFSINLNTSSLLRELIKKEEQERASMPPDSAHNMPSVAAIFKALGLEGVGIVSMSMQIKPEYVETEGHFPVTDVSRGIFAMYDTRPSSIDLRVPFVSPTAYGYSVSRLDMPGLFRQLPSIVQDAMPQFAFYLNMGLASAENFLGIRLEQDLFAHLDTQVISVSSMMNGKPADLMAVRLNNVDALRDTLEKVFNENGQLVMMMPDVITKQDFLGTTIYIFNPAQSGVAGSEMGLEAQEQPDHAIAIDGGYLLYGPAAAIRGAVRSFQQTDQDDSFYASRKMQKLREMAPADVFQYSMYDWPEMLMALLNPENHEAVRMGLEQMVQEVSDDDTPWTRMLKGLDFSHWPSARHLASFLGPSFDYTYADETGLRSRTFFYHEKQR